MQNAIENNGKMIALILSGVSTVLSVSDHRNASCTRLGNHHHGEGDMEVDR